MWPFHLIISGLAEFHLAASQIAIGIFSDFGEDLSEISSCASLSKEAACASDQPNSKEVSQALFHGLAADLTQDSTSCADSLYK